MSQDPLTEEYGSTTGDFVLDYSTYQTVDQQNLALLKHRDIRVLQQGDITTARNMLDLDTFNNTFLDTLTMTQLESSTTVIRKGEGWTTGTVATDAARANFKILSLTLIAGTVTTSSVDTTTPVDLLTDFADTDHISIALPSFPLAQVTQASSFIDFTSNPTGNFATGPTASVALSASTVALIAGNSEFRVNRSAFNQNSINLSAITGVRLRIVATGAATLRVAGIRLLKSTWVQGANGVDTRYGRLRKGLARNGDTSQAGFTWPILWRATTPQSTHDPKPIDGETAVIFNTGAMVNSNQFTIYYRELTEDFLTQLDIDGLTQAGLDGRQQPDIGTAMYSSRTQTDIEAFSQTQLDADSQFDLERKPDYLSASWINYTFTWSAAAASVTIQNTESGGGPSAGTYVFPIAGLTANTDYIFFSNLEENSAQATLFKLDSSLRVGDKVFDSTLITDDGAFPRRKGRFGWFAQFGDGDATIDSITMRKVTYAEYRSLPFASNTPVVGAELFASGSPNIEHFQSFVPGPYNAIDTTVARDAGRSTSGLSYRVDSLGTTPNQGLSTNYFLISDLHDTEIQFDLWYPAEAAVAPLIPYLVDRFRRIIPLSMPRVVPDQWQHVRIVPPFGQTIITGTYQFVLFQPTAIASSWWVDSPTVFSRSIVWEGRAVVEDPWQSNDARWVPFRNVLNSDSGGILFARRGSQLQVRAKATQQAAHIDRIQFRPKYAELGRFVDATVAAPKVLPTASFTSGVVTGRTIRFTDTSVDSDGFIVATEWNFGDGTTGIGSVVDHTYVAAATYNVTVVTMDNNGNRSSATTGVVVA